MLYYPEEKKPVTADGLKVVVLTCNWNAYSGLEGAGKEHTPYPAAVLPVRVECLGRIHPGMVLKAFQKGAAGVLLLGCGSDECHFDFGFEKAEAVYSQTKNLLRILGFKDSRFKLDSLATGQENGNGFVKKVNGFIEGFIGSESIV